jgi:hypothetical protein
MAETKQIINIPLDDPIKRLIQDKNHTTQLKFSENELVNNGDIYHNKTKVTIVSTKGLTNELSDTAGKFFEYVNTKITLPTSFKKNEKFFSGIPTYNFKTVRTSDHMDADQDGDEQDLPSYYFDQADIENKKIIFHHNTKMYSLSEKQKSDFDLYNDYKIINIETGQLATLLNEMNYFNLNERFNTLINDYSTAIEQRYANQRLNLKMLTEQYADINVNDDLYYLYTKNADEPLVTSNFVNDEKIMLEQIRKEISKNCLSYKDIIDNKDTTHEALFFKIEKWFSDNPIGNPDQTFLVSKNVGTPVLEWLDTQIFNNKSYAYRITLYYAVTSIEYYFSNVSSYPDGATFDVDSFSKINFYKEVIFEENIDSAYYPPLPPRVHFYDKSSPNKGMVKIYLELQKGEQDEHPVEIYNEEERLLPTDAILDNGKIRFRYRSESARFEVYRTTEKPTSYTDFENNLIGTFENNNMRENMVVIDSVLSNKSYYYTFRTINELESFSNPTPIYEVKIIQDSDNSKVSVKLVQTSEQDTLNTSVKSKDFKSLLKMGVSSQQLGFLLDPLRDANGDIFTFKNKLDQISLGLNDLDDEMVNKVWGRKFKFRVRSNDSGKIIDFNVKVNIVKEKSEEDFPV